MTAKFEKLPWFTTMQVQILADGDVVGELSIIVEGNVLCSPGNVAPDYKHHRSSATIYTNGEYGDLGRQSTEFSGRSSANMSFANGETRCNRCKISFKGL